LTAGGFSAWQAYTPCGTLIDNDGSGHTTISASTLMLENHSVKCAQRWYFYKNYIIGEYTINPEKTDSTSKINQTGFFVLDECNGRVCLFGDETSFASFLKAENLKPLYWTRWYDNDWYFSRYGLFAFLDFGGLFAMLMAILIAILAIKKLYKSPKQLLLFFAVFVSAIRIWLWLDSNQVSF
jgi:hypothetical protein